MPDIIIDHDCVTIEGTVIMRPVRMSPTQWLEFWENVVNSEPPEII
jgi:hypothetical protein